MLFIDLEKAYDREPCQLIWQALQQKGIHNGYIGIIQDMHEDAVLSVLTVCWGMAKFPVRVECTKGLCWIPIYSH